MAKQLNVFQDKILGLLSNRIDDFYLTGGTALSKYYFHHRDSLDLDFFTREFNKKRALEIIDFLSRTLKRKIELSAEQTQVKKVKIMVYVIKIDRKNSLKIDFAEDCLSLINTPKLINGIKLLSLEDIYIRKIYTIIGTLLGKDSIGRNIMQGGRQEAKDFYDLYCLSNIFMRLSGFSFKYCNQIIREALIRWFRTYDRTDIRIGLLELKIRNKIDYKNIEQHFKKEIERIIEKEVEFL